MPLAMTRPTKRGDSSSFQFKKRTPAALLTAKKGERLTFDLPSTTGEQIRVSATVGPILKLSLRTRDNDLAKQRCAAVNSQVDQLLAALSGGPRRLSQREVVALAGMKYREAIARWEDDPGPASAWEHLRDGYAGIPSEDLASLEDHAGFMVDDILAEQRLIVDADTRHRLLLAVRDAMREAYTVLSQRACNDFSPNTVAEKFPVWEAPKADAPGVTITGLLQGWAAEAARLDKSPSTIDGYGRTVRQFAAFLGHDNAARVTRDDVLRYKDKRLIEDGRSPRTVLGADLAALKAVFGWAVANGRLEVNPASEVTLKLPKKPKRVGYSDAGALTILQAALDHTAAPREGAKIAVAKRWAPWLCAFTGARVGEIVQLRREDVRKKDGVWTIWITPEAGRVKDREEREVPLHPQLIELGLIDYVKSIRTGYLFVSATDRTDCAGQLQSTINRLGEFARALVRENRVTALHGWRHRFITLSRRHGVDLELRRKITGHAGEGVDEEDYGDVEGLYREICKLPRYSIKPQT
ncbi:MAG: tyrosine-type recombinase/integrase [Hyphomicrobium sp.]